MTTRSQAPNKEISGQIEKSELLERLKAWAAFLSEIDQEEDKKELEQICASLVSPDLLDYQDPDIKLFVACCCADVLRIYAPEAPYADDQLKEIFMMFVNQLRGLEDITGKSFKRYFYLLENLACVKTFILCMELDAPDIILSLFRTFFQIFNEKHVGKVQTFMVDIMMTVMQEGDTIPQDVMDIILMHVIQPYKTRKPAAFKLASELINKSASYLEPNLQKFFTSALMKGIETDSGLHSRVYDLIKELNRVCPSILLAVLPQLGEKLKSSDVNERLEVTRLLAEMFSDKNSDLATQNKQLWNGFLRRFNDIEAAVRAECVSTCKNFILHHLKLSDDCYSNLCMRHRDPDEKVRLEAVKVVYAIASEDMTRMTPELFMILQERMLDKKWPIRHQAIMNVARLYKNLNSKKDLTKMKEIAWMPNKVLHTYYQNTSQDRLLVERLLLSCLVPVSLGAKDRMNILLRTYCLLDHAAIKALNELLKYQQTIRMHLAALLRAIEKGIGEEDRKKLLTQVSFLSKSLPDTKTANSDLKRLSNTLVHDRSLLKAFQSIVTPGVSCQDVAKAVSEIMKKLTNKNPIMDTIRALMDRTAPVLADSTCITILVELVTQLLSTPNEPDEDDDDPFNIFINGQKGLHLLLSLATVYPGQFKTQEVFEQLLINLKNRNSEVVLMDLKILSKTAHGLDKRFPTVASCLQPQLIKIAKEGTVPQAKQAVQVIHVVYQDSPKVLERLLDSMSPLLDIDNINLPSVVKAIGQVAKVAPKTFSEFSCTVVRDFLLSKIITEDGENISDELEPTDDYWCESSELNNFTRVKMEGLHLMVNWVARSTGEKEVISSPVLQLLWSLLQQKGDMNGNKQIRLCSMSHLRLHGGLCVLKLAAEPTCCDLIPVELFQEVAWLIQDPCVEVKQAMLTKLHKGMSSLKLPLEYVALLAFYATDMGKERRSKARQILLKVIQLRRDYMVMNSSNSERNHTVLPEYALPTLIHLLAHHPNMDKDNTDSLKSALDVLWFFLEPLMQKNDNFPFLKKLVETVKQAVDALEPENTEINDKLYAVCDLAFGVINLKCANTKLPPFPGNVKLSKKYFAPPESAVSNTESYLPENFDFSPNRTAMAVEMEIDHPTVTILNAKKAAKDSDYFSEDFTAKRVTVTKSRPGEPRGRGRPRKGAVTERLRKDDGSALDTLAEGTRKTRRPKTTSEGDKDVSMEDDVMDDAVIEEDDDGDEGGVDNLPELTQETETKKGDKGEEEKVDDGDETEEEEIEMGLDDISSGSGEDAPPATAAVKAARKPRKPRVLKEKKPKEIKETKKRGRKPGGTNKVNRNSGASTGRWANKLVSGTLISGRGVPPPSHNTAENSPVKRGGKIRPAYPDNEGSSAGESPAKRPFYSKRVVQSSITDIASPIKKGSPAVLTVGKKRDSSKYGGLFDEPVLPKPKAQRDQAQPKKVIKIKINNAIQDKEALKKSFAAMCEQLMESLGGMDDDVPGQREEEEAGSSLVTSTPAPKKGDIRSFYTNSSTPATATAGEEGAADVSTVEEGGDTSLPASSPAKTPQKKATNKTQDIEFEIEIGDGGAEVEAPVPATETEVTYDESGEIVVMTKEDFERKLREVRLSAIGGSQTGAEYDPGESKEEGVSYRPQRSSGRYVSEREYFDPKSARNGRPRVTKDGRKVLKDGSSPTPQGRLDGLKYPPGVVPKRGRTARHMLHKMELIKKHDEASYIEDAGKQGTSRNYSEDEYEVSYDEATGKIFETPVRKDSKQPSNKKFTPRNPSKPKPRKFVEAKIISEYKEPTGAGGPYDMEGEEEVSRLKDTMKKRRRISTPGRGVAPDRSLAGTKPPAKRRYQGESDPEIEFDQVI